MAAPVDRLHERGVATGHAVGLGQGRQTSTTSRQAASKMTRRFVLMVRRDYTMRGTDRDAADPGADGAARRARAAVTSPAAETPAAATAAAPAAGRVFVTNESSGDITVIDVAARQVVATIPVGKRPRGIRLSPDGQRLFVALSGSPMAPPGVDEDTLPPADKKADGIGIVSVRDLKLERVVRGGSDPEQTAISLDGTRLFVANEDVGEVSVIAVDDGRVLATFKVGGEPEGVDLRPDGRVVYVTSEEDSQVAVIDAIDLTLLTDVQGRAAAAVDGVPARQLARLRHRRERRLRVGRRRADARGASRRSC